MRLLADEGVERRVVERLRQSGFEVEHIAEVSPASPDEDGLLRARTSGAVLLTQDKDFGELVFRQRRLTTGVLLIRLAGLSSDEKADLVLSCLRAHGRDFHGAFSVLTAESLRVRRL